MVRHPGILRGLAQPVPLGSYSAPLFCRGRVHDGPCTAVGSHALATRLTPHSYSSLWLQIATAAKERDRALTARNINTFNWQIVVFQAASVVTNLCFVDRYTLSCAFKSMSKRSHHQVLMLQFSRRQTRCSRRQSPPWQATRCTRSRKPRSMQRSPPAARGTSHV